MAAGILLESELTMSGAGETLCCLLCPSLERDKSSCLERDESSCLEKDVVNADALVNADAHKQVCPATTKQKLSSLSCH